MKIYFNQDWLDGKGHGSEDACKFFSKHRMELFNALKESTPHEYITDKKLIDEDTIFFTSTIDSEFDMGEYSKIVEEERKAIDKILKTSEIKRPKTASFWEFLDKPFFPVIAKSEMLNAGMDKILIENREQLVPFFALYQYLKEEKMALSKNGGTITYKHFEEMVFQQYIETPSEYNTSLRVYITGDLSIEAATIEYGKPGKKEIRTPLEGLIHDSRSPFFINNKSVTSNSECGGDNIVIGKDVGYSKKDKEILKAHGFDPQNCVLPKELEDISKRIMKGCAKFLGIVAGFDFILNNADKKWYFLEVGGNPTPHDYSLVHGLGYSPTDNTIKNVTKSVQIDLKVRTEALAEMIYQRKESLKKKQAKKKPTEVTA